MNFTLFITDQLVILIEQLYTTTSSPYFQNVFKHLLESKVPKFKRLVSPIQILLRTQQIYNLNQANKRRSQASYVFLLFECLIKILSRSSTFSRRSLKTLRAAAFYETNKKEKRIRITLLQCSNDSFQSLQAGKELKDSTLDQLSLQKDFEVHVVPGDTKSVSPFQKLFIKQ